MVGTIRENLVIKKGCNLRRCPFVGVHLAGIAQIYKNGSVTIMQPVKNDGGYFFLYAAFFSW